MRIAILGAGNIAGVHAQAVAAVDGATLALVCERSGRRGRALAERFGARYVDDPDAAVDDPGVDAIVVATPSGAHTEPVIRAAQRGKHALVEKPLDITLARIDAMLAAAERAGTVLAGVFQARTGDGVRAARRALEAGRLGRLALANATVPWHRSEAYYADGGWRGTWALDGGGALMNQGIHTVDLLQHLAGPVVRVSAHTDARVHAIETEDTAAALLRFAGGAVGTLQATTAAWPGLPARVELYGEHGSIVLADGRVETWRLQDAEEGEEAAMRALDADTGGGSADPMAIGIGKHVAQVRDFVEAVRGEHPPMVPGIEARRAVEIVRAVYASQRNGAAVTLPLVGA